MEYFPATPKQDIWYSSYAGLLTGTSGYWRSKLFFFNFLIDYLIGAIGALTVLSTTNTTNGNTQSIFSAHVYIPEFEDEL